MQYLLSKQSSNLKKYRNFAGITCIVFFILSGLFTFQCFAEDGAFVEYTFENVSNGTVYDNTTNKVNASLQGNAMLTSGIKGSGIWLDGVGDSIKIANSNIYSNTTSGITFSMWVKPKFGDQTTGTYTILQINNNSAIIIDCATKTMKITKGTETVLNTDFILDENKWHHISFTYNGSALLAYVNGKSVKQATVSGLITTTATDVYIGGMTANNFKGSIDEVSYFKSVLAADQILQMYNNIIGAISTWDNVAYPLTSQYPNGIAPVDEKIFKDSKINYPINTGFEERNETNAVSANNYNGQLEIVEDKYNGKFALKVTQKNETDYIPLKESEIFKVSDAVNAGTSSTTTTSTQTTTISGSPNVSIDITDKTFKVYGNVNPNIQITLLVRNSKNGIAYIDQEGSNSSGYYEFVFSVAEFDTYTVTVGGDGFSAYQTSVNLSDPAASNNVTKPVVDDVFIKTNIVSLWVKPMYKAESISFYTKAIVTDAQNNTTEQYVLIKSDKNGDGVFIIGEDFSQGKWQNIDLNLLKTDVSFGNAKSIYIKANVGSQWIFDDITSSYLEINDNKMNLGDFARGNVVMSNGSIKFSSNNDTNQTYDTNPIVTTAKVDINEKISGIEIDSDTERKYNGQASVVQEGASLLSDADANLSSSNWTVNGTNYDTLNTGVSKSINAITARSTVPTVPATGNSFSININSSNENRFRIIFNKPTTSTAITIAGSPSTQSLTISTDNTYSAWFSSSVNITTVNSSFNGLTIKAIEYEPKNVTAEKNILIKKDGTAILNIGNISAEDRVKVKIKVAYMNGAPSDIQNIRFAILDGNNNETYYTRANLQPNMNEQVIELIVPKIALGSSFKIQNLVSNSTVSLQEIRLISFNAYTLVENDFDYTGKYLIYKLASRVYFNSVVYTNTEIKEVKSFYTNNTDDLYAVKHLNANGTISNSTSGTTFSVSNTYKAVFKFVNLNKTQKFVTINSKTYWLNYGECDIEITEIGTLNVQLPPSSDKILLLQISFYKNELINNNYSTVYKIDGLYNAPPRFSSDGSIVVYQNYLDKKNIYAYNFKTDTYKKIGEGEIDYIELSPDGSCIVTGLNKNFKYYNGNMDIWTNLEVPSLYSYTFKFNKDNELFLTGLVDNIGGSNKYIYQYKDNELVKIYDGGWDHGTPSLVFNKNGDSMVFYWWKYFSSDDITEINFKFFRKENGIWINYNSYYKEISYDNTIDVNVYFSPDSNVIYYCWYYGVNYSDYDYRYQTYSYDIHTNIDKLVQSSYTDILVDVCGDGRLLFRSTGGNYNFKNIITNEKQNVFYDPMTTSITYVAYSIDDNQFTYMDSNGNIAKVLLEDSKCEGKYLLSFDGKDNWYAFKGGRWVLASTNFEPTPEEIDTNGMTASEVNSIRPIDFDKIYLDGSEVLTVNVALYMSSYSRTVTPVIKSINVKTMDDKPIKGLFAAKLVKYDKSDYRLINAVFPIEDFTKPAECYYLMYIGNEWLYTFKDGKLVKLVSNADELFTDINKNWIEIKQYGMDAKELRNVSAEAFNLLFVNKNYANSEFGIIYVIKADDESTQKYKVDLRIQSEANYFDSDSLVFEIVLNGNDVKLFKPEDITRDEIEKFMSWLEGRQQGKGTIFYRLKIKDKQFFINYYMITSVNVYNSSTYVPEGAAASSTSTISNTVETMTETSGSDTIEETNNTTEVEQ